MMPVNFKQVLTSKNFISAFNRWFVGTTTLGYFGLAFSVSWTNTMRLIVLASYAQSVLIHFYKRKRLHLADSKLTAALQSTVTNLAIVSALLTTFSYVTLLLAAGNPSWWLLRQLIVAILICGCLFGANLIVLKRLIALK